MPKSLLVQRIMGEGSFGQVFEGTLTTPAGSQRVVMKRVKARVEGSTEMAQMEHLLNVYASRVARGHCADFVGYCEVADSEASVRLTAGLWLVWKYEGSKTLSHYLRRRDTTRALAEDLGVPEGAAVAVVMKHVFEGLAAFHAAGLVHRDIKPLNIILADSNRRFKLIDLGACADLRTGTNYVPEESILDLNYCPPEQYVLPTDSPHIAKQAGLLKLAISPMLWAKHKPDRFDTWSAGMVMLQLAIPAMRNDRALKAFNTTYGPKYKYDLSAWRKGANLYPKDCELLDANDGAGWELLQSLLAPRHIQVDDNGGVSFVNDSPFPRISAYEALKHRYIKLGLEASVAAPAVVAVPAAASTGGSGRGGAPAGSGGRGGSSELTPAPAAAAAGGGGGQGPDALSSALGLWRDMTGRLFDLEAKIVKQASATELQTTTVKRLQEQVVVGRADPEVLKKEEQVLDKMQNRLAGLQQDFASTANQANSILSWFGFGRKQQPPKQQPAAAAPAGQAAASGRGSGERRVAKKPSQSMQALRAAEAASAAAAASASRSSVDGTSSTPAPASAAAPSAAGMFSSLWERLSSRLGDLEGKISNQASATERQSLVVRGLRAKVRAGEADRELLDKAERTLGKMEKRLLELDRDYRAAKQNASGALAGNVPDLDRRDPKGKGGSREQRVADAVAAAEAALKSTSDSTDDGGSFWSRLMGRSKSGSSGTSPSGSRDGSGSAKERAAAAAAAASTSAPAPQQQPPRAGSPFFRRAASPTPASSSPLSSSASAGPTPRSGTPSGSASGSGYRSIFGGVFGGPDKAALEKAAQEKAAAEAAAAAAAAAAANPPRATSPRSGGFFGGLFGGGANNAAASNNNGSIFGAAAASGGSSSGSKGGRTAGESVDLPVVPPPAAPAQAASGEALVEGAARVIKSSLGFTGLAARVAGDLAAALKADAERMLKDMEAAEAAKRQQRTLEAAFTALLREASPPLPATASYEEAQERFGREASWIALGDEAKRQAAFAAHQGAVRRAEEQVSLATEAAFRAALRRYKVTATSQYDEYFATLGPIPRTDPSMQAIKDPSRREQLFYEVVAELQLQAALQAAAQKAELEFTTLLAELRDPPVTSTSTWALVRKAVAADARSQALPERRRRELFEAYTAQLFEAEARRRSEEAAEAAAREAEREAAGPAAAEPEPISAEPAAPSQEVALAAAEAAALIVTTAEAEAKAASAKAKVAAAEEAKAKEAAVVPAAAAAAPASFPVVLDDEDLSEALAGMEAALETAVKAVTSPPPALPSVADVAAADNGKVAVGPGLGLGMAAGGGGANRLEDLRREQARLRAEYEAMASRLREMEERLRTQQAATAAAAAAAGVAPAAAGLAGVDDESVGAAVQSGGGGGAEAEVLAGAAGSNGNGAGPDGEAARGRRWR
ncbi:hypothetical protein HYH03_011241 [Edaphochlamys debaryana]|uniref:Protein kinase domain-containing protein n=1 Tax=Edaphochlamys debaryana TaxID=47281 RepID=A0A835XV01_9CHLO|nr:hypothetical protein HYH03_011241 [Edaphochlamys debaryana]|eukprot:KAG2490289.1 hypothetical protein HYH03_011241 [Edaphochlamys debaryana]